MSNDIDYRTMHSFDKQTWWPEPQYAITDRAVYEWDNRSARRTRKANHSFAKATTLVTLATTTTYQFKNQ